MPFLTLDHETATNDELMAACSDEDYEALGTVETIGRRIVKISEQAVIKNSIAVTAAEANNLKMAYELLDPNIVRVPRVYRFFTDGKRKWYGERGYLVMEYIKGRALDPLEDPELIRRIAHAVAHFAQIPGFVPGPLCGGGSRGLLWPLGDTVLINSTRELERFYNSRLGRESARLALGHYKLVLCHLDIAPRNILWLEDDSFCLLDWESAGFYPRFFETCVQRVNYMKDGDFNRLLLESMEGLNEKEETDTTLILQACNHMTRFHL